MIRLADIKYVYFLGIGGIGMSALARYFYSHGAKVAGYDRVNSPLTDALQEEGIQVIFDDDPSLIPSCFLDKASCLFVYTPAIPKNHAQKTFLLNQQFELYKRAEVLGLLSRDLYTLAVAGTHGKTTVSTMLAWLMQFSEQGAHAFLGGISKNFNSNYFDAKDCPNMVVEADEFDRSFMQLSPNCSIITALDADHLDIYGTHEALLKSFADFANLNRNFVLLKHGLELKTNTQIKTYSLDNSSADFYAENLQLHGMLYHFDLVTPSGRINGIEMGVPGLLNCENAIAASAMALMNGLPKEKLGEALSSFQGIKRRFEIIVETDDLIYIDDYAHHPEEIRKTYESLRQTFPGKKLTAIFQPHLFSRTNDFASEFADSLSAFDEIVLLPIYPAREEPILGIDSNLIFSQIENQNKQLVEKSDLLNYLQTLNLEVLISLGAGDIDRFVPQINGMFHE